MISEQDLKEIRKNISTKDNSMINISRIYMSLINATSHELLNSSILEFHEMDEVSQELIIKNIKKTFSGSIGQKVFTPEFKDVAKNSDGSVYSLINKVNFYENDNLLETGNDISKQILNSGAYKKSNFLILFAECGIGVSGEYKNIKILTICKTKPTKSEFVYNNSDKTFKLKPFLDCIIQLASPLDGIAYPLCYKDVVDKSKCLYYSSKADNINLAFLDTVLHAEAKITKKQEKIAFGKIMSDLLDTKVSIPQIYKLYENFDVFDEENQTVDEDKIITKFEIKKAFEKSNLSMAKPIDEVFQNVLNVADYEFNAVDVLPNLGSKSVHIKDDDSEINIKPKLLEKIKQTKNDEGEICLLIPVDGTKLNYYDIAVNE